MSQPTERQVLYALVAAGFLGVIGFLITGAAVAGAVPIWWTIVMGMALGTVAVWTAITWRQTARVLLTSVGLLVVWLVGTLLIRT